jgi:hypothetical protein
LRLTAIFFVFILFFASSAFAASRKISTKQRIEVLPASGDRVISFSDDELKQMGEFLSNFTELGFMELDIKNISEDKTQASMIRFGIWHNYINNFYRTAKCKVKNCPWGSLSIKGKYVMEPIKKYFGVNYIDFKGIEGLDPQCHYDGVSFHFEGLDGEAIYRARVEEASQDMSGQITMAGEIFNSKNEDDILGRFEAVAKPHKYGRVKTWAFKSIKSESGSGDLTQQIIGFKAKPTSADVANRFSVDELKQMGLFLSSFTELGFMEFDMKDISNEETFANMIQFGIWHNYINNSKRVTKCKAKNCKWGSLSIKGKYVTEVIKKYFGVNYTEFKSITELGVHYHYDGKSFHFDGLIGEAVYYANVDEASRDVSGQIVITGELYNAEDENDILGKFEAVAKQHKIGKKKAWAIISMKTEYY